MGKNKGRQFNLDKRAVLARMVAKRDKAKDIGTVLGMDPTSISRELLRNRVMVKGAAAGGALCDKCANKPGCKIKRACGSRDCSQACKGCKGLERCRSYEAFECDRTKKYPFVCNGCAKEGVCPLAQYKYLPDAAQDAARERLVLTRQGADLTEEELRSQDALLKDRIVDKGQSVHHVLVSNRDELKCSEKTLYARIEKGVYSSVKAHHLPRQVSLKKRKRMPKKYEYKHAPRVDRTGHLHSDWLIHRFKNAVTYYFQMDFLGAPRKSSKEILVLTMPEISFSLLYVIEGATQEKVAALMDKIEEELGPSGFKKLFPAILTDRDTVFDDFSAIELSANGERRTRVFFCDPGVSNQKPHVENYNAQTRPIFPKHAVLNEYSQDELYVAASHLNSRRLSSIDDRTPADLFVEIFGEEMLEALHQKRIPADKVKLKPIH